jgi:dTMP kinase
MAREIKKGLFITFEGPEGSGKSTHSKLLVASLVKDGYEVLHTYEPGDTPLGKRVRDILLEKDDISLGRHAELLLFEADRAQHVEEVIKPALSSGKIVVCDRFNTATFAYQGYGLGLDMGKILELDKFATGGLSPDLTLLLDIDVDEGLNRASAGKPADRMEKRGGVFHRKVRDGYLAMAAKDPARIKVVPVTGNIENTYAEIREKVYAFIQGYKRAG